MPALHVSRQPKQRNQDWFRQGPGKQLVAEVLRQTTPELARVFGQSGLYLRPASDVASELSGNKLANIISLYRTSEGFDGQLRCLDSELPVASESLSLVFALFVLETSFQPEALLQEIARILKPEGVAMILSLNPISPSRLRWAWQRKAAGFNVLGVKHLVEQVGLEVMRQHHLGPRWVKTGLAPEQRPGRSFDAFRAANFLVARRRESALTPLRKAKPALKLSPGMIPG